MNKNRKAKHNSVLNFSDNSVHRWSSIDPSNKSGEKSCEKNNFSGDSTKVNSKLISNSSKATHLQFQNLKVNK